MLFPGSTRKESLSRSPAATRGERPGVATGSFDDHVAVAKLLLGFTDHVPALQEAWAASDSERHQRPRSDVLGSLLGAVVRTGRLELARPFFGLDVRVTDPDDPGTSLLTYAVISGSMAMVQLIMDPGGVHLPHPPFGRAFETAAVLAIRRRALDIARFFLEIWETSGNAGSEAYGILHHSGVREVCHHGDIDLLELILERPLPNEKLWVLGFDCCVSPLEIAARAGHLGIVSILLSKGLDPRGKTDALTRPPRWGCEVTGRPRHFRHFRLIHHLYFRRQMKSGGAMFGAAVMGHVDVAELLLDAGPNLSEVEWHKVAIGAIELQKTEFVQWMLARGVFPARGGHEFDPMGYACVWGSQEIVRLLATWGYPPSGSCVVDGLPHESLVLAALNWSRPDIVETLLLNPLLSTFGAEWKAGPLPRKPNVKPCRWRSDFRVEQAPLRTSRHPHQAHLLS